MEQANCIELFKQIRREVDSDEVAIAVMQEVGKTSRVELMASPNVSSFTGRNNGDELASWKQRAYLRNLGVQVPMGLTRRDASKLIEEAKTRAN